MFDLDRFRATPPVSGKARASTIPHSVYVVACPPNFLKIGVAWDVEARIAGMRTGNPHPLTLRRAYTFKTELQARLAERAAHMFLIEHRHVGEWFTCSEADAFALLDEIEKHTAELARDHLLADERMLANHIERIETDAAALARREAADKKREAYRINREWRASRAAA